MFIVQYQCVFNPALWRDHGSDYEDAHMALSAAAMLAQSTGTRTRVVDAYGRVVWDSAAAIFA